MNAREFFKLGDRVRLTRKGFLLLSAKQATVSNSRRDSKYKPNVEGKVVGFSAQPDKVRICVDGYVNDDIYELGLWEKI